MCKKTVTDKILLYSDDYEINGNYYINNNRYIDLRRQKIEKKK